MKKFALFVVSVLMAAMMVFSLPAAPAAAAGTKSIKLVAVHFIGGKGIVFVFDVKGKFDSFKGSVNFQNVSYPLSCKFRDDGKLSCTIPGGAKMAGKTVFGSLNGFSFSARVPYKTYCSPIYDLDLNGSGIDNTGWEQAGTYCQETEPNVGDEIYWYNPEWQNYYWYVYANDGSEVIWWNDDGDGQIEPGELVPAPSFGEGYYWW